MAFGLDWFASAAAWCDGQESKKLLPASTYSTTLVSKRLRASDKMDHDKLAPLYI